MGHQNRAPPQTPVPEDDATVLGTQDYMSDNDGHGDVVGASRSAVTDTQQDMMQHGASSSSRGVEQSPRLQRMQNRSLRSCCERVVHESHPGEGGNALRPFRARA